MKVVVVVRCCGVHIVTGHVGQLLVLLVLLMALLVLEHLLLPLEGVLPLLLLLLD